jgi:hypothetical protein
MDIENCDCSEFERRGGYIPCESLIAGEISALKGKSMSPDLIQMDGREYEVIRIEEAELKAIKENEWKNVHRPEKRKSVMLLVASIVGMVVGGLVDSFVVIALTGLAGALACLALLVSGKSTAAQHNKIQDIEDNRLGRLRNKVEVLEGKMATAKEFKEDLEAAKNFFKTLYDLYLGQRHRPITKVAQNTVFYPIFTRA